MSETSTPPLRTNKATVHYLFSVRNMFSPAKRRCPNSNPFVLIRKIDCPNLFFHADRLENESVF